MARNKSKYKLNPLTRTDKQGQEYMDAKKLVGYIVDENGCWRKTKDDRKRRKQEKKERKAGI